MASDVTEWLARSSLEAIRANEATDPRQAAEHREHCLLYTGRVMAALIEERVAFPFKRAA